MQDKRVTAFALALALAAPVVARGYGLANRQLKIPATRETAYKIGSVSKQFIATGIMLLVQEGRLTIRHLLTHTSGLVRDAPGFDRFKVQSDADVIRTAFGMGRSARSQE